MSQLPTTYDLSQCQPPDYVGIDPASGQYACLDQKGNYVPVENPPPATQSPCPPCTTPTSPTTVEPTDTANNVGQWEWHTSVFVAPTLGMLLLDANANRQVMIIQGSPGSSLHIGNAPDLPQDSGLYVPPAACPCKLSTQDYPGLVQQSWYNLSPTNPGDMITIIEGFYRC